MLSLEKPLAPHAPQDPLDSFRCADRPASSTPPLAALSTSAQRAIYHKVRADQVCVLTFDRPGSGANIFDRRTLEEFSEELDFIARSPQLKGVIITSAKPSIFVAGADLRMLSEAASAHEARELIELGQNIMNRVAALPIPTAAAVHGAAVGGGYELCLACDYRIASTDRATKLGLPETQLGLLPAWGGSTRLPRLIGLPRALGVILGGKTLAAKPALKCGMVDELTHREYLEDVAARLVQRGKPRRRKRIVNNWVVANVLAARLRKQLLNKTRGNYPAVLNALEVVTRGISKSIPTSLALECDAVLELIQSESTRNLVRVFLLQERAKKLDASTLHKLSGLERKSINTAPAQAAPQGVVRSKSVARAAVIGGGVMGAGIAQWLSARQLRVILRDINTTQVAKGMATVASLYNQGVKRHLFTAQQARDGMDRIYPAAHDVPLGNIDVAIEAAVENLDLKKNIFQRLDELAGEQTILATNTSALPVSELAAATRRPERVVGVHFFNPVHRMQLVEIVVARHTSVEVLARTVGFVQQIGKLPLVVKDSPGFLVNRILMPYLVEAGSLFESGAGATKIDEAMLGFGMPMGPLRLLDEVGVDVALHVAETLAVRFKDRMKVPDLLKTMVQAGALGRKSGRGFYIYSKGKEPEPNFQINRPQILSRQALHGGSPPADLQSRMVLLMINEAVRCLEEEIVAEPADVDFGMIMGTGFAPFRGGPLRYADSLGLPEVVKAMQRLANTGLSHFQPCALLQQLGSNGKRLYPSSAS